MREIANKVKNLEDQDKAKLIIESKTLLVHHSNMFLGQAFQDFEEDYLTALNVLLDKERQDAFFRKKETTSSWFGLEENEFEDNDNDIMNHLNGTSSFVSHYCLII